VRLALGSALAFALLAAPALARKQPPPPPEIPVSPEGLVDNVNGYTIDRQGGLEHFSGLLIGKDGRVAKLLHDGDLRPQRPAFRLDGQHRTLLPGLIDAHGHVSGLGFQALSLDLTDVNKPDRRARPRFGPGLSGVEPRPHRCEQP